MLTLTVIVASLGLGLGLTKLWNLAAAALARRDYRRSRPRLRP